jgi:predicted metal-dependent hydrolase
VTPSELRTRRVSFSFPDDLDPAWTPRNPEVAIAANSVSMLMPHVEPYIVRTMRAAAPQLDPETQQVVTEFNRQELRHHAEHRRFNDLVIARYPGLARVDGWMRRTYGWLGRTRSLEFSVAFAASSETAAFAMARWTESHMRTIFDGADELTSTLFLWHLAEEVEHKSVAFDVHRACGGRRRQYAAAATLTILLLTWFAFLCSVVMLRGQRRLHSPLAWFRMLRLVLSVAFDVLPAIGVSMMKDHHPSDLSDPALLTAWLRNFDPDTATMPLWSPAGSASPAAARSDAA